LSEDQFVVASKRAASGTNGSLQVTLFQLGDNGTLTVLHSLVASADISTKVSVARVDDIRFVVAARNGAGNYVLLAFKLSSSGITETSSVVRSQTSRSPR
jgi:hypothetical protein